MLKGQKPPTLTETRIGPSDTLLVRDREADVTEQVRRQGITIGNSSSGLYRHGTTVTSTLGWIAPPAVPEPATRALLLPGLAAVGKVAGRRRA